MQIEIQWNQEDLERKLLEELAASGFRTVEGLDELGKPKPKFKWAYKPSLKVTVKAEPDPDAVLEPKEVAAPSPFSATGVTTGRLDSERSNVSNAPQEKEEEDDTPLDPTMFPPGTDMKALRALEQAAKDEKDGKPVQRRFMQGESRERPDNDD